MVVEEELFILKLESLVDRAVEGRENQEQRLEEMEGLEHLTKVIVEVMQNLLEPLTEVDLVEVEEQVNKERI